MNRRAFLSRASAALVLTEMPSAETPRRRDAETPSQDAERRVPSAEQPSQADRLYNPNVVQERAAATERDNDPAVKALEHRLKCTCGCNLDIYTCRTTDFTCTYSPALHREVLTLFDSGKSADQVVEAFVAKYGESILMAPRPEGFNLAGYLVPGIVIAAVALLLAWVLVRRGRRLAPVSPDRGTAGCGEGGNPAEDERLRSALEEVED